MPREITSILSMFGELSGKILSTPTPYEILRTVNVDREPFATRRMHTPSKAWRRVFSPSRIFAQTLMESPGRNSGRVAVRRWLFSIESRIRWALMATSIGNGPLTGRLDEGFYGCFVWFVLVFVCCVGFGGWFWLF